MSTKSASMMLGPMVFAAPAPFDISTLSYPGFKPSPTDAARIAAHTDLLTSHLHSLDALLVSWESRIAALKAERSNLERMARINDALLAPIRALPTEVLACIFGWYARSIWEGGGSGAAKVMEVCRLWKDVALATPQMWAFLSFPPRNPIAYERHLTLSGAAPLHIRSSSSYRGRADRDSYGAQYDSVSYGEEATGLLRRAIQRAASIDLMLPSYDVWLRIIGNAPLAAPRLHTAHLQIERPELIPTDGAHILDAPGLQSFAVSSPAVLRLLRLPEDVQLDALSISIPPSRISRRASLRTEENDLIAIAQPYSPRTLSIDLCAGPASLSLSVPPSPTSTRSSSPNPPSRRTSSRSLRTSLADPPSVPLPRLQKLVFTNVGPHISRVRDFLWATASELSALEELIVSGSATPFSLTSLFTLNHTEDASTFPSRLPSPFASRSSSPTRNAFAPSAPSSPPFLLKPPNLDVDPLVTLPSLHTLRLHTCILPPNSAGLLARAAPRLEVLEVELGRVRGPAVFDGLIGGDYMNRDEMEMEMEGTDGRVEENGSDDHDSPCPRLRELTIATDFFLPDVWGSFVRFLRLCSHYSLESVGLSARRLDASQLADLDALSGSIPRSEGEESAWLSRSITRWTIMKAA